MRQDEGYDEHQAGSSAGPTIAELSEDDGYVSPEFDLSSESDMEYSNESHRKKPRTAVATSQRSLEADEELALSMLRGRR